ncbi:MAG TPA: segregation/condensation protein A [Mycobacteriales bacterium]|nr:segregation/condensation protein A [Mycobacteriales bacterium]
MTVPERPRAFEVRLENFEGPFDLLLSLISRHQLDVTEVALSRVTDEFIAHIRALGSSWDLGQATEFLVVAATLLDLKAARLLPSAQVEDEEDLALLEARDLLFARLLQYRAYKQVAAHLGALERAQSRRFPRAVPLEPRFAELMPEVLLTISPEQLARIAAGALRPKPVPTVSLEHVHTIRVSVREQVAILRGRLARTGRSTFRGLTQDCQHTVELVARFLALLELYREGAVAFDQVAPLGELWVRWTGASDGGQPGGGQDLDEEYG